VVLDNKTRAHQPRQARLAHATAATTNFGTTSLRTRHVQAIAGVEVHDGLVY